MAEQNETKFLKQILSTLQEKKIIPILIILLVVLLWGGYVLMISSRGSSGRSEGSFQNQTTNTSVELPDSDDIALADVSLQTATSQETIDAADLTLTITRRPTSTDEYKSPFRTFTPTADESPTKTPFGWTPSPTQTATETPIGWTTSPTTIPTSTNTPTTVPGELSVGLGLTASSTSVDEPGGRITYQVEVTNTYDRPVELNSLTDSVIADLRGEGSCNHATNLYPVALAAGSSYTCAYSVDIVGDGDEIYQNFVTVEVEDALGRTVTKTAEESVSVTDLLPSITVSKVAGVASVIEPGDLVTFEVEVTNTSVEPVILIQLLDNQIGTLHEQGTCLSGGEIGISETYLCSYTAFVSGTFGDTYTNIFTARVMDSEYNSVSQSASASVAVLSSVTSVISGQVRLDADGDGDLTDSDIGLQGVEIELKDSFCISGLNCPVEVTDAGGNYAFTQVAAGDYTIVETDLTDYYSTNDSSPPNDNEIPLTVEAGVDYYDNDFLDATCSGPDDLVNGYVIGTIPLDDATISLGTNSIKVQFDRPMNQTGSGSVLLVGNYQSGITNLTYGGTVPFTSLDYDADTDTVTLVFDTDDPDWLPGSTYEFEVLSTVENFCGEPQGVDVVRNFSTMSAITGQVREDLDGDGDLSDPDPGIPGVTIELEDATCILTLNCQTTVTDSNGEYEFIDLAAGDYMVYEYDLDGYSSTNDFDGGNFNQIEVIGLTASEILSEMDFLDEVGCSNPHPVTGFVSSTNPADGQTGVDPAMTQVVVVFNQAMLESGRNSPGDSRNYSLRNVSRGRNVSISGVLFAPSTSTAYVTINTSSTNWRSGDKYIFTIESDIQNSCSVSQGVDVEIDFQLAP